MGNFKAGTTFFVICLFSWLLPIENNAAEIVTVVSNYSSGIANADMTATLDDGTVLGFKRYNSGACFCGAITQQEKLTVPDSIKYSSNSYAVTMIGYVGICDFSNAKNVMDLTLPSETNEVQILPSTVTVLHTKGYIRYINPSALSNLLHVFVPETDLKTYYEDGSWYNYVLISAEGTDLLKITINMTKAGEFAQLLLQQTDNWNKVNELTVIGELNIDDLKIFSRMKQLTKLDLSQAEITDIPQDFDGAGGTDAYRVGFGLLAELSLPDVNNIGNYAFAECPKLKKITMAKVNSIGQGAFARLGATEIVLPEDISSIGNYAFYYSNLSNVEIPASISEISDYCFYGCANLKSATISSSVKRIGSNSFQESGLTSISLPGVETIGQQAFLRCPQLSEVIFGENLNAFSYECFAYCTALTEIDLPASLRGRGQDIFSQCTNIKKIISRAVISPKYYNYDSSILTGCDMTNVILYVPAMSIDNYRREYGWKEFYTILPLEDKTSNLDLYDNVTINDATEFTTDCNVTLGRDQWDRNVLHWGNVDYNGNSIFSMHNYSQYQYMGESTSDNQYSGGAIFTSLIANGPMRADSVSTILRTPSTDIWYFISFPYDVKVSDIGYTEGTQFAIRKYSGQNRAQQSGPTWVNLTADSIMHAYEGYILKCNKQYVDFEFPAINDTNKNKVFENENVIMPLGEYLSEFEHNRSWNLIGNPYPCYYDTRFMGFTAPITVWNRYYKRYDAFSPVDDEYILHPSQSFFVQRPVDCASIIFDKAGRQKEAVPRTLPALVKERVAPALERKVFNIMLSNGLIEDHTRIVKNDNALCDYERDKDASKFIADDNTSVLIYSIDNGVKYAINERPIEDDEVQLGMYAPAAGQFVLSLNSVEEDNIILVDHEMNSETVMTDDYHFYASAGYNEDRFSLKIGDSAGVDNIRVDNNIDSTCAVYSIDGRLIGNYTSDDMPNLAKGIYIIVSKDVKRKIVVK